MAGKRNADDELSAISTVIAALDPLDGMQRLRVLDYVFKRLDLGTISTGTASAVRETSRVSDIPASPKPISVEAIKDIRTLKDEKQPRSANEMAVLVAYYLSELAPLSERKETINQGDLNRYFRMAAYRLPKEPRFTLVNAMNAGYLDNVARGEYRLNPVGYNLIVHALPSGVNDLSRRTGISRKAAKKKSLRR